MFHENHENHENHERPSGRTRRFAAIAALAAALLMSSGLGAQEGPPESAPPGPEPPRASVNGPGPQDAGQGSQDQPRQPPPQPGGVEQPGDAEEPRRESREEAARDKDDATARREAADLAAQQSMAASAVKMLDLTFAQIVVGTLGIIGLGATVHYTRVTARAAVAATAAATDSAKAAVESARAAKVQADVARDASRLARRSLREAGRSAGAALAAVQVAERTAERQLRAYVGVADDKVEMISPGFEPMVSLEIKNFGQTPAYNVTVWTEISVMEPATAVFEDKSAAEPGRRVLNPGTTMTVVSTKDEALTEDEFGRAKADTARLYCFGTIRFTDAFRRPRIAKFRFETRGGRIVAMERLTLSDEGNEAD